MENKKEQQAKRLELLIKARCRTGELSDEELDGVSGGAVLNSNQVYQMRCSACGWASTPFDASDPYTDADKLAWQHICFAPDCEGGESVTIVPGTVTFS